MSCYTPIEAWQPADGGPLTFKETKNHREIKIPCGKCIGCRITRQRQWAVRCLHESQMHEEKCFVTLTYNDEHYRPDLSHKDFQKFIQRLRIVTAPKKIRYFMAGEYGSLNQRPHYHALLYGVDFKDKRKITETQYTSKILEKIWENGYVQIGEINEKTTMYTAKYTCQKITGEIAQKHYARVDTRTGETIQVPPEYAQMSLKPGIGSTWFDKNWREIYAARDAVVLQGGKTLPPPRFYDERLKKYNNDLLEHKKAQRYKKGATYAGDTTPARLAARELCAAATAATLNRKKL